MKLLAIALAIGGLAVSASAAPAPTTKPAPRAVPAKAGAKKPTAKAAPSKRDQAAKALMALKLQAERLDSCASLKSAIPDVISTDAFTAFVEDYLGALSDRSFEKGEFETSAEAEKRLHDMLALYLGDPDRVVMKLPIPRENASYDADAGVMTVSLPKGSPVGYLPGAANHTFLTVYAKEINKGRTSGVTRMGVKFRYDQYIRMEEFVAVPDRMAKYSDSLRLDMARDEAKARIDHLYLIMLGSIQPPYAQSDDDEKVASLDSTYEQYTRSKAWYVEPRCIYLIDDRTKAVLGAFLD